MTTTEIAQTYTTIATTHDGYVITDVLNYLPSNQVRLMVRTASGFDTRTVKILDGIRVFGTMEDSRLQFDVRPLTWNQELDNQFTQYERDLLITFCESNLIDMNAVSTLEELKEWTRYRNNCRR